MNQKAPVDINTPLTLPCGVTLSNRLAKAAMTERLCFGRHRATPQHVQLYQGFLYGAGNQPSAESRLPGMLLTGNIMIDRKSFESAGNVSVETEADADDVHMRAWTTSVHEAVGADRPALWAQVGHPGRQTSILLNRRPVSPSTVKLKKAGMFARPRALGEDEIEALIGRFIATAALCKRAGFSGVQIHAAHGYLGSQFLSPLTNLRTDRWGGSLENRFRFLQQVVNGVRKQVGSDFPVAVKLNSADFQKGGFSAEESMQVVSWLDEAGVDLIEISGGSYENPSFLQNALTGPGSRNSEGPVKAASTLEREAFFLEYARDVRSRVKNAALMVTGGFRSRAVADGALASGDVDVVGCARPFLSEPSFSHDFLSDSTCQAGQVDVHSRVKLLALFATGGFWNFQLQRLARGRAFAPGKSAFMSAMHILNYETKYALGHYLRR